MPSQRFYKLSREKQGTIWRAAVQEFASVPYEKVSINKIIRSAGISRGSFYTYFEDKRDLLSFLLEDTSSHWKEFCISCLERADGDIFSMMETLMEYAIDFCKNNGLFRVHRNLVMYPADEVAEFFAKDMGFQELWKGEIFRRINRSHLRDGSAGGITLLMKLCMITMIGTVAEYLKCPEREELVKDEYKKALSVFRYGAYNASENEQVEDKTNG